MSLNDVELEIAYPLHNLYSMTIRHGQSLIHVSGMWYLYSDSQTYYARRVTKTGDSLLVFLRRLKLQIYKSAENS